MFFSSRWFYLAIVVVGLLNVACGNRGSLYLPDEQNQTAQQQIRLEQSVAE